MPRLCLTAEGRTEQTFAFDVLRAHLALHGVYLAKGRLTATGRNKGRVYRGGMFRYVVVKTDIGNWLKEDRSPDVFFTTMLDLYGLPDDFPGYEEAHRLSDAYARVAKMEEALVEDIGDSRFIPYLQLHEFEALLFSDPQGFGSYYRQAEPKIARLKAVLEEFQNPELINDGETTAPSKRIAQHFPEYARAKSTVGPIVAMQIGLEAIRAKCRHFNEWLAKLEKLGAQ